MVATHLGEPHVNADGGDATAAAAERARVALRAPYMPEAIARLAALPTYFEAMWAPIEASIGTAGFLGSALYVADMALDTVERVYQPVFTREDLTRSGLADAEYERLIEVLDVFHYVQPQLLLIFAALAEAFDRDEIGGHGRIEPRPLTPREEAHLRTAIPLAAPATAPLPEVAAAMSLDEPPELYRAVASWPAYLLVAWEELQHLAAYPEFRRRGRALYFYARSGARFLAEPLRGNRAALLAAGVPEEEIDGARAIVEQALPAIAMMVMHAEAMRVGLGVASREVVQAGGPP